MYCIHLLPLTSGPLWRTVGYSATTESITNPITIIITNHITIITNPTTIIIIINPISIIIAAININTTIIICVLCNFAQCWLSICVVIYYITGHNGVFVHLRICICVVKHMITY